jgi:hypothetical protein
MDTTQALALLRRDYPPQKLEVNPKPDVTEKFSWSPRLTFLVGSITAVLLVAVYLTYQYISFISPPSLEVYTPTEYQELTSNILTVSGKTDSDAVVKINNQSALIDDDGNFSAELNIFQGTLEIEVVATSRSGKETVIKRKIVPKLEESTRN